MRRIAHTSQLPTLAACSLVATIVMAAAPSAWLIAQPTSAQKHGAPSSASRLLYITTNDPTPGQNAVLAFRRGEDCRLIPFGRYLMGGTGVGNPDFRLGPLDSDQSLVVSPDRRFVFAVNSGSDSIAVFRIRPDGSLVAVDGSPFSSGGHLPATLGFRRGSPEGLDQAGTAHPAPESDDRGQPYGLLLVAHKNEVPGENPLHFPLPNYTSFIVDADGRLMPIRRSTIEVPRGSSPTQVLVSNDGRFVFSTELLVDFPTDFFPTDGFPAAPGAGGGPTLRSFVIRPNGGLRPASAIRLPEPDAAFPDPLHLLSGSAHISGTTNGALGLQDHPTLPILYVGYPLRSQIGVYTWNRRTGALTLRAVVSNSGQVICWIQVSEDGQMLYTTNQLDRTVSVYDLSDPLRPAEIGHADLRLAPGATQGGLAAQQFLAPGGRCLYALEVRTTDAIDDGSSNALHSLTATPAGITEPFAPIDLATLGVPRTARPQGIAAF